MRIIRFEDSEGRVVFGDDHRNGSATVLLDADGLLGPKQDDQARRELLRGTRALIADDDEGIRQAVDAILRRFDCACTLCKDGNEALRAIGETELDLVVSDIIMPGHDGYEVFAAAKQAQLAVVLITGFGYDPDHTLVRCSQQGGETVLYKPFTPQQLVQKVFDAMRVAANGRGTPMIRAAENLPAGKPLAPLMPRDILCVGRNYGPAASADLELFMKPRSAVQDPGGPIRIPDADADVACEGELAVVIGRTARAVSEADALDHVFGYVVANDVTARRWHRSDVPMTWMRGKGFDTFCPIGPAIVTADEVPDPNALAIATRVNGQVVRRGTTGDMARPVARLISEISRAITLHPGTLLLTGAPPLLDDAPGVGLATGDEVSVEIETLGELVNPVIA